MGPTSPPARGTTTWITQGFHAATFCPAPAPLSQAQHSPHESWQQPRRRKPDPAHHLTHRNISGHRGLPEDVATTVRFLCGPSARYITGQAIHTNAAYLGA